MHVDISFDSRHDVNKFGLQQNDVLIVVKKYSLYHNVCLYVGTRYKVQSLHQDGFILFIENGLYYHKFPYSAIDYTNYDHIFENLKLQRIKKIKSLEL